MNEIVSLSSLAGAAAASQTHVDHARAASDSATVGSSGSPAAGGLQEDSVMLSAATDLVQQAWSAGAAARANRVQELKQQIDSGQYNADPAAVGSAVIGGAIAGD